MPTETAPQPPVAAPAAVTPPSPAPASTPAPVQAADSVAADRPINSVTKKPITDAAHKLFKMLSDEGPLGVEPEEKKTADAPAPTPPPAPEVKPKGEDDPPVKVSKKAEKPAKRPELPVVKEEPAPTTPKAEPAPVDSKWEEELLDDEKAALEDARFAEKVDPKHKGLADRMGKFFRDQKKYLEDHPDASEDDPAYKKILATAPSLSAADKRAIAEARIEERVARKHEDKFAELEQKLYERDEEPKIEQEASQIRNHLAFSALPKEMLDIIKTKGAAEGVKILQKDYADEMEVAGDIISTVTEDAKELLRITRINPKTKRPLSQAADSPSHPKWEQHNRIAQMVNEVGRDFQKNAPQSQQVRDGKWFVTREEWARIPANARHQFWTFTNSEEHVREMIERALSWAPEAISQRIAQRREALQKRGWEKRRTEVAPPPAPPPTPVTSTPSPRTAPAPAPSNTPAGTLTFGQQIARNLAQG